MRRAFSVIGFAFRAVYEDWLVLAGMGGVWLVASLLLPAGVSWLTQFLPFPIHYQQFFVYATPKRNRTIHLSSRSWRIFHPVPCW